MLKNERTLIGSSFFVKNFKNSWKNFYAIRKDKNKNIDKKRLYLYNNKDRYILAQVCA